MKRKWPAIVIFIFLAISCSVLLILGFILFQSPSVPLVANGKIIAVVKQPLFRPLWNYGQADVYTGQKKIFSLSENYLLDGGPVFIYPFADGKRFLCDYDDDTSMLDFVVDLGKQATDKPGSDNWPMNSYAREYLTSRVTNVVFNTKAVVRLPNYAELREVSQYLSNPAATSIKPGYFYSFCRDKFILLDLATNRQSLWPIEK